MTYTHSSNSILKAKKTLITPNSKSYLNLTPLDHQHGQHPRIQLLLMMKVNRPLPQFYMMLLLCNASPVSAVDALAAGMSGLNRRDVFAGALIGILIPLDTWLQVLLWPHFAICSFLHHHVIPKVRAKHKEVCLNKDSICGPGTSAGEDQRSLTLLPKEFVQIIRMQVCARMTSKKVVLQSL